jgi:uncharacterized membrane protein
MARLRPSGLVLIAAAAYAAGFAALSILRHRSFHTGRFDLGNMVQSVWTTAHGDLLKMTDLRGHEISRLAAHFDPILVVFAPLWWLWPSPDLLLTAQAIIVALGAIPVFWLARKHLASERAALGFALVYLVYPAVQWLTVDEFHPVALACPLLLLAFWYLDEDRLVPFAICAAIASMTKEEIPLVIAGMGAWYGISRRRWAVGGAVVLAGIAVSLIAVEVVVPHFNRHGTSRFYGRYHELGRSPGAILGSLVHHPVHALETAFDGRGIRYLLDLALPLAGLCLLAPLVLVAALPEVALNLLSNVRTQTSIHFHYTAGLVPPLVVAAIFGAKRLVPLRPNGAVLVAGIALGAALVGNYRLGPLPIWRDLPGGSTLQSRYSHVSTHDRIASRALELIPPRAAVSATNSLGAHLSARRTIMSFPELRGASWVAVDETALSFRDRGIAPLRAANRLVRLRRSGDWRTVFEQAGVVIFRRAR